MKSYLLSTLRCPACSGELGYNREDQNFTCLDCQKIFPALGEIPLFSPPPEGLVPTEKLKRGPDLGTPWRKANWRFLKDQANRLNASALILDVGAGRGDFEALFAHRQCLALDVYPYPEVDLVADLTRVVPFQEECFDAILLMNVVEHIFDTGTLVANLARLLKPGGALIVAIPFLVKIHQAPVDFVRYTHYALERLGADHGLAVESLEGYYDPIFFLNEGLGNLRNAVVPGLRRPRRWFARLQVSNIQFMTRLLSPWIGAGKLQKPAQARSQAPTGYHVVYRKPR